MRTLWSLIALVSFMLAGSGPSLSPRVAWADMAEDETRAESILGRMSLEEKIDFIGGVNGFYIRSMPRLGVPALKMADGPLGVRNFGPATAMAGGIALAATWDAALAERVGKEIGRDARAKGVHFLLGPGVNLYRAPMNGRNFEYFGEDPFLASIIAVGFIKGVQGQGVSATIKHFMANNSEFDRHNSDSVIDERTMREIYLPVFEAAVKNARVGSIMTSYNLTNGVRMSQNAYLNTDVVKGEWGFDGVLMSDWGSTYNGIAAANGGLDLEMPSGAFMNRRVLIPAIEQGRVSRAALDDKVRRILRTAIRFGWLDRDQADLTISRYNLEGRQAALDAARGSMVLLKNEGDLLPLSKEKLKSIAVIGPNAHPAVAAGGGSAGVEPFTAVSFLEGLSHYLRGVVDVYYNPGIPTLKELAEATVFTTAPENGRPGLQLELFGNAELSGQSVFKRIEPHINMTEDLWREASGQAYSARWSGYYTAQSDGNYDVFVQMPGEGVGCRLFLDDKLLIDAWRFPKALADYATIALAPGPHRIVFEFVRRKAGWGSWPLRVGIAQQGTLVDPSAVALAGKADAVVVAAGFNPEIETEGGDRTFRLPVGQDELIKAMAAANKNTIVVIISGGAVDMSVWLDRVPALIEAWYPGQEGGTALAEIIFGETNPSGRLPVSFEMRWEDNPVHDSYYPDPETNRIVYKEGVFVGYRGYEHRGIKPLFPFGYGLSYTTFKYGNLSIRPVTVDANSNAGFEIAFDLTNTGNRPGAEVAQVYVGNPRTGTPRPLKELRGVTKTLLFPGERKRVTVILERRAFCYYDARERKWNADPGEYEILVGRSSEQIELRHKVTIGTGF